MIVILTMGWIYFFVLLKLGEFKRCAVIAALAILPLPFLPHQFMFICGYYLYLNLVTLVVYSGSIALKFRLACEHLRLVTALKHYPKVVRIRKESFRIDSRAFKVSDFEDKRAELASYMGLYIRDIKPGKRLGLIDLYYSKEDLPQQVEFNPNCNFGELVLGQ